MTFVDAEEIGDGLFCMGTKSVLLTSITLSLLGVSQSSCCEFFDH